MEESGSSHLLATLEAWTAWYVVLSVSLHGKGCGSDRISAFWFVEHHLSSYWALFLCICLAYCTQVGGDGVNAVE